MRSASLRALAAASFALGLFAASPARASNVTEFPDNGSEQMGRGGAWVARASDPLATTFNPAGLAGQYSKVTVQNGVIFENTCFSRLKALNDTTNDPLARADGSFPEVCNDGKATLNPQIGATIRLTDRLGLGLLLIGPSSAGEKNFPDFVNDGSGQPVAAPQRYLLVKQSGIIVFPTIGLGYEVVDNLRIGASFAWGISRLQLANASMSLNADGTTSANDTRAVLQAQDYFVPGVNLGVLYSPLPELDIAGWFKWSDAIRAYGDVGTATSYYTKQNAGGDDKNVRYGDTIFEDCGTGLPIHEQTKPCNGGNNARLQITIPVEAKIGIRYHKPRVRAEYGEVAGRPTRLTSADPEPSSPPSSPAPGAEGPPATPAPAEPPPVFSGEPARRLQHVRDPLSTDVFDVELDLTWAHNSQLDPIIIRFPGDPSGKGLLPVSGIQGADLPPNADIKRGYKDVVGVRLGGDYNILPDKLAVRAGGFFESSALDPQYQAIDFIASSRFGLALGATYRIRFGGAESTSALEIMAGFGHVFFGEQSRTDRGADGQRALAGSSCNGSTPSGPTTCADGNERYRSKWPVNLGTITSSVNVINVGLAYRF
ncbi:MAG: outer membrane protein transport protein [Deltaproteobacteria bacterium]|nr:outer membrane protein transport protein [Deltaproteobacteria bacterium]